jgi:hypothetical protein
MGLPCLRDDYDAREIINDMRAERIEAKVKSEAPAFCRDCDEMRVGGADNTIAFDVEPRLRGYKDFDLFAVCDEFPDGCEPRKCNKRILEIQAERIKSIIDLIAEAEAKIPENPDPFDYTKVKLDTAREWLAGMLA